MSDEGRRFHLLERLGTGAFGEVFLAEQESPGGFRRRVALKLIRGADASRSGREAARRMRDEARLLGLLSHRNIVGVVDLVRLGDAWAIVMDPVPGADLERVLHALDIERQQMPPRAVFQLGAEVAAALDAAWSAEHGKGAPLRVIHRDIKPSNVILTPDGDVKVLDFGVARMNLEAREARTGGMLGTVRYMAPERVLRRPDGPAGDVYALAATAVELLLGEAIGASPVDPEPHAALVDALGQALRARLAGLGRTEEMIELLTASLAADPDARPTAHRFAEACEREAARMSGPDLRAFAKAFVPRVDAALGPTRGAADGVLSEHGSGTHTDPRPVAVAAPAVRRRYGWAPLAALALAVPLLAGALVVLVVALGAIGAQLAVRPTPAPAPVEVRVEPPPPPPKTPTEEVVEPVPAEPPPVPPTPSLLPRPPRPAEAVVEPIPTPASPEPEPAPAPAPVVAVEVASPPPPPPPPPTPVAPDLRGTWEGTLAGRPMVLKLRVDGSQVSGTSELTQGTTVRSGSVSGTWSAGHLVLVGATGERLEGALLDGRLTGTWTAREGARPMRFDVRR